MKDVLMCGTTLNIGTISSLSTAVWVYLKNHATGRIDRYSVTTTGAGLVALTISSVKVIPDHPYEVWVTLQTATNVEANETITISAVDYTCLAVRFKRVMDSADTVEAETTQTLAADA